MTDPTPIDAEVLPPEAAAASTHGAGDFHQTAHETGTPPPPPQSGPSYTSFGQAFRAAAADARKAATEAAPKIKTTFAQAGYDISYAAGFTAVFGITLLRELLPNPLKQGFAEGADQGRAAAESMATPAPAAAEAPFGAAPATA